jgi:hypothetical protein
MEVEKKTRSGHPSMTRNDLNRGMERWGGEARRLGLGLPPRNPSIPILVEWKDRKLRTNLSNHMIVGRKASSVLVCLTPSEPALHRVQDRMATGTNASQYPVNIFVSSIYFPRHVICRNCEAHS